MKKLASTLLLLSSLFLSTIAQTFTDQLTGSGLAQADKIGQIKEVFDYNNDGYEDLIFATKNSMALLYQNNGNGTFSNVSTAANFPVFKTNPTTLMCLDLDNNGYRDIIYYYTHGGGSGNDTLRLFMNNGGVFTEKTTEYGISNPLLQGINHWNSNILPMDYDRDGDLDILFGSSTVTGSNSCTNSKICILENNLENPLKPRMNKMTELVSYTANILPASIGVTDYNNDQLADFVVCEQNGASGAFSGYRADPFVIYKNNGNGTFTKATGTNLADAAVHNFITLWDYNNDGWLDFVNGTSDCCGTRTNIVWKNNGNGTFTDMRSTYNLHPVNDYYNRLSAVDFNNDGNPDLSTTMLGGYWSDTRHQLWENNGTSFSNTAATYGLQIGYNGGFNGIASECEWLDVDNDGDLDFYAYNWNSGSNNLQNLMINPNTTGNKYLRIKLVGTYSPVDGTGSRVVVKLGTKRMTQYNNWKTGNNFSDILHFGLAQNAVADSVYVYWSSGNVSKLANVPANQLLTITEHQPVIPTAASPLTPDANTILLDRFDKATAGEIHNTISYSSGLTGLSEAINMQAGNNYLSYALPNNLENAGTVEMWVKLTRFDTGLLNINWNYANASPGSGHVFHLRVDSVGRIGLSGWGWSVNNSFASIHRIKMNTWTHIAVSWGDSTKIFINGQPDMRTATPFRPAVTSTTNYYYLPYWGDHPGYIDELHISKTERSNAEIASRVVPPMAKTVQNMVPGTLSGILSTQEKNNVLQLKLTGKIDARDFKTMRDEMPLLAAVDLSETTIEAYYGTGGTNTSANYQANTIPQSAFFNPTTGSGKLTLANAMLPAGVQLVDVSAFEDCRNLQAITFASGLRYLADYAFYNCRALTQISLPASTLEIGLSSFESCRGLTSVSIPDQVTTIGASAFWGCTGLTNITFGSNVTSIGDAAFWGCYKVNSILAKAANPPLLAGVQVFGQINKEVCQLSVPTSSTSLYSKAPQWKDFMKTVTRDNLPVDDKLTISSSDGCIIISCQAGILSAEVFDSNGQLHSRNVKPSINTIIRVQRHGIYLVRTMLHDGTLETTKVIL